jgi:predicted NUDIX family NTP pyrophosphohydrolase
VHPGGPFGAKRGQGTWSIPKGLIGEGEDKLEAAKREFAEETSILPSESFIYLGKNQASMFMDGPLKEIAIRRR